MLQDVQHKGWDLEYLLTALLQLYLDIRREMHVFPAQHYLSSSTLRFYTLYKSYLYSDILLSNCSLKAGPGDTNRTLHFIWDPSQPVCRGWPSLCRGSISKLRIWVIQSLCSWVLQSQNGLIPTSLLWKLNISQMPRTVPGTAVFP